MTSKTNNHVELVIFKCKEKSIPTPLYNDCIIGKGTDSDVFDQGTHLEISISKAKSLLTQKMLDVPCLADLRVKVYYGGHKTNQMNIIFDDVKFECDTDLQKKGANLSAFEKICYCANNMRNGKCPYQIAKKLFPNVYKEKQR